MSSYDITQIENLTTFPGDLPAQGVGYSIGFRSPTAIINGNISFGEGIAVPNVKVVVEKESELVKDMFHQPDKRSQIYVLLLQIHFLMT